jgi:UDP-glucose 4-epimerase
VSIQALAERVKQLTGSTSPIHLIPYSEAYEEGFEDMPRRVPDIQKVRELVGYEPKLALDEIIGTVIDHMRTA